MLVLRRCNARRSPRQRHVHHPRGPFGHDKKLTALFGGLKTMTCLLRLPRNVVLGLPRRLPQLGEESTQMWGLLCRGLVMESLDNLSSQAPVFGQLTLPLPRCQEFPPVVLVRQGRTPIPDKHLQRSSSGNLPTGHLRGQHSPREHQRRRTRSNQLLRTECIQFADAITLVMTVGIHLDLGFDSHTFVYNCIYSDPL